MLADISGAQENTAKELGDRAAPIQADVTRPEDAQAMIDLVGTEFGGIDVLCNVAGTIGRVMGHFHVAPDDEYDFMVDVNLRDPYNTMRSAIPVFIAGRRRHRQRGTDRRTHRRADPGHVRGRQEWVARTHQVDRP